MIDGLAACITKHGYAAATIGGVAKEAKVSNSTVYSHFADKEAVLVALYDESIDRLIGAIEQADAAAFEAGLPWRERVEAGVRCYVSLMAGGGSLTRAMLLEAPAVSPRVFAARQRGRRRYVELLERLGSDVADRDGRAEGPPRVMLVAAVGGINELLLGLFDEAFPRSAADVTADATALLCALLVVDGQPS